MVRDETRHVISHEPGEHEGVQVFVNRVPSASNESTDEPQVDPTHGEPTLTHRYTTRHHVLTHTRNTHYHKDEMRALMEVASFITADPLIPCYPTNPVIATERPDYRG